MARRKGRSTTSDFGLNASDIFPAGTVLDFAGTTAPSGWLLCYGQTLNREEYSRLFSVISTTYGAGDGSTTFTLPDCRGRVSAGKDNMGGVAANRLTASGSGITGTTLGAAGGAETHTLTQAQLATHTHTQNAHDHTLWATSKANGNANGSYIAGGSSSYGGTNPFTNAGANSTTATNNNTGSGSAHQNTQPSIVFNKIIKI